MPSIKALTALALILAAGCADDPASNPPPTAGRDASTAGAMDSGLADAGPAPEPMCAPDFAMADACGGDVTGTWTYRAGCTDDASFPAIEQQCPGFAARETARTTQGTVTLGADGTFTRHASGTASYRMDVPAVCAAATGGCAGFGAAASAAVGSPVTCTADGANCDCTGTIPYDVNDSGTYTTANGILTATTNGGMSRYHYCVADRVLTYREIVDPKAAVFVATR